MATTVGGPVEVFTPHCAPPWKGSSTCPGLGRARDTCLQTMVSNAPPSLTTALSCCDDHDRGRTVGRRPSAHLPRVQARGLLADHSERAWWRRDRTDSGRNTYRPSLAGQLDKLSIAGVVRSTWATASAILTPEGKCEFNTPHAITASASRSAEPGGCLIAQSVRRLYPAQRAWLKWLEVICRSKTGRSSKACEPAHRDDKGASRHRRSRSRSKQGHEQGSRGVAT